MVQGWWGGRSRRNSPSSVHYIWLAPKYPNLMLRKRVDYTRQNFDYDLALSEWNVFST
jgi:hypothetical protein